MSSAFDYLEKIKSEIKYKNRFFIDSSFCEYIKEYAEKNQTLIEPSNHHFFRARLYLEDDQYEKYNNPSNMRFAGYDEKNSFVNLTNPVEGRGNPRFIPYLYVSTTVDGAIVESRPCANTLVSVAKIEIKEPLRILDFAKIHTVADGNRTNEQNSLNKAELFSYFNDEFCKPNYEHSGGYLLTQYICE